MHHPDADPDLPCNAKADRFAGALLGTACGDALGAPFEGAGRPGTVRDFRGGQGRYTDDTQMTIALAESLVRTRGRVDGADCARAYAERYEPHRGYGHGAHVVMEQLRSGADYRQTGTAVFSGGSFGNGSAMRIAPVGLLHGRGRAPGLREAVFEAVRCTHLHPEAIDGAVVQARLVGVLSAAPVGEAIDVVALWDDLYRRIRTDVFERQLQCVGELLDTRADEATAVRVLGNGIRASEAVPAATWAAFRHGFDPEESIVHAVALGGDTDTIAAMTGALVGARVGASALPVRWLRSLENDTLGRDDIERLGRQLASLDTAPAEHRIDGLQ